MSSGKMRTLGLGLASGGKNSNRDEKHRKKCRVLQVGTKVDLLPCLVVNRCSVVLKTVTH